MTQTECVVVFLLEPHGLEAIIFRGDHVGKHRNKANLSTVLRKELEMLSLPLDLPGKERKCVGF